MASFPVWVGSLPDHVDERSLEALFQPYGPIRSIAVMRDERGKSKCFGYVNFVEKSAAELSANNLKGRTVEGARIKVKGPRELEKNYGQGLSLPANSTQKMDYRPYTDCDFFVRGKECNPKSKRCPYRHSVEACAATFDCPDWLQGRCLDKACPMIHASRKLRQERETFRSMIETNTSGSEESFRTISDSDSTDGSDEEIKQATQSSTNKGKQRRRGRRGGKGRGRQRLGSSTGSDKGLSTESTGEPIGVFWDIENCPVPPGKSVLGCVNKIREDFFNGRREAEFICVCDINKERKEVIEQLNAAQVNVVHVCCVAKNAADDKLRQSLRRFGSAYPAPATVLLISGDVNFAPDLSDLRHRHNLTVYLLHNPQAQKALISCAHKALRFDKFTSSLPNFEEQDAVDLTGTDVMVTNLPGGVEVKKVRNRLSRLSANCGGRVMHVEGQKAILRFTTKELAAKAQKRIDGEDVYRSKIKVTVIPRPKSPVKQSIPVSGTSPPPVRNTSPSLPQSQPLLQAGHPQFSAPPVHPMGLHPHRPSLHPPVQPTHPPVHHLGGGPLPLHHGHPLYPQFPMVPPATCPLIQRVPGLQPPYPVARCHLKPPISIPGVKSRLPPFNPPGGVDLVVTGVPKELSKTNVRKEIQSKFGQYGKVVRVIFHPPDGAIFECVYVTVESHCVALKCIMNLKGTELLGSTIMVGVLPELNKLLLQTRQNCYAILSELPSGWMMLRTFFDVYRQRFQNHCRFSLLDKVVDTVCLDGQCNALAICLSSRSPRAKVKPQSQEIFYTNIIHLFQCRGTINMMSFASEYVNMFQSELPFHKDGEALEDILKAIPGITIAGQLPDMRISLDTGALQLAVASAKPSKTGADLSKVVQNIVSLLNSNPGCAVLFESLVGSYHRFCGTELKLKQCGFSKLGELLSAPAVSRRIQITGTGREKVVTLRHRQQLHSLKLWLLGVMKDLCRPRLPVDDFMPAYQKHSKKNLQLSDYGVTKLCELFDSMSDITDVKIEESTKYLCLRVPHYLSDVAQNVENMLKDQPEFSIELMRFQKHYELLYGQKLAASEYGFAKLSDLLNFLPDVKLQGSGTALQAVLSNAVVMFAHQARRVLEGEPGKRLNGCKFAAAFHQTHNRQVKVSEYGCSKLKELVHAVPETLRVVEENGQYFIELIDGKAEPDPNVKVLKYPYCTEASSTCATKTADKFAIEARELLENCPGQCVPFNKFTAAYNQHFKRQCRVADYGFTKLAFLLKAVPESVQLVECDEELTVCLATGVSRQDSHDSDVVIEGCASSDEDDGGDSAPAVNRQSSCSLMDFESVPTADIIHLSSSSLPEACSDSGAEPLAILDHPVPDLSTLPLLGGGDSTLEAPQERSDQELMAELSQGLCDSQRSDCLSTNIDVAGARASVSEVSLISLETPPATTAEMATAPSPLTKHRQSVTSLLDEPPPLDLTAALLDASNEAASTEEETTKSVTEGMTGHTDSNQSSIDEDLDGSSITRDAEVDGSASLASRLIQSKLLENLGDVDTAAHVAENAVPVPTLCESEQKRRLKEKVSVEEKIASLMSDNAEQLVSLESTPPTNLEPGQCVAAEIDEPAISNQHPNVVESSGEDHDATVGAVGAWVAVEVSSDCTNSADYQWEADGKATQPKTKTPSKPPTSRCLAANFSMAPPSLLSESQK